MERRENVMRIWCGGLLTVVLIGAGTTAMSAESFAKPTAEELSMTSLPGYPGAAAVVLYREETADDNLHAVLRYERIKVLTEEGKKYANVELNYIRTSDSGGSIFGSNEETVGEIVGRTIHPDGTIIPFSGKPYEKTIEKTKDYKYQARVFTLPSVEVGSIIEYRYATRYSDNLVQSPEWYIQGNGGNQVNLFVKSAHYVWHPSLRDIVDSKERPINAISWFPILPDGAKVVRTEIPGSKQTYEVKVKDIPPVLDEEYMPPLKSYSYRVLFSLTAFRTADEYWQSEGKDWSKRSDSFMKESKQVAEATQTAAAGATTSEAKLRAIYAKVMTLENTDYTREHDKREDGKLTNNVTDVLTRARGTSTQLTELFVAMARAAGFKSYVMLVPDRSVEVFTPIWLSFRQFDDYIAIVNVDGKDVFFDPGERFCAYGHLAWQHTFVGGLRQMEGGAGFAQTLGDGYAVNKLTRVANLNMDEKGEVTGKIDVGFTGSEALRWRHVALRGDSEELKKSLRKMMEENVPTSLEITVSEIKNLDDYEKALTVSYDVKGTLGTPTGKRLVMPVDFFTSGSVGAFADEKRQSGVDFKFAQTHLDALRVNFKKGFEVEAAPKPEEYGIPKTAQYSMKVETTPTSFTTRRNYTIGDFFFDTKAYPALRTFYSQMSTKDKESVILKVAAVTSAASGN
jgi:hypothetical protein